MCRCTLKCAVVAGLPGPDEVMHATVQLGESDTEGDSSGVLCCVVSPVRIRDSHDACAAGLKTSQMMQDLLQKSTHLSDLVQSLPAVVDIDDDHTYNKLDQSIMAFYAAAKKLHPQEDRSELGEDLSWGGDKKDASGKVVTRRRRASVSGAASLAKQGGGGDKVT